MTNLAFEEIDVSPPKEQSPAAQIGSADSKEIRPLPRISIPGLLRVPVTRRCSHRGIIGSQNGPSPCEGPYRRRRGRN